MLLLREDLEAREHRELASGAAVADESRGRRIPEDPDPLRTCYQRDRDRILHCKAFRRLSHKTQVFIAAEGDHYRTRLTHTLEVAQIARSAACSLGLNCDLTEAIALGHDLGHTPFGHTGEHALRRCLASLAGVDPDSAAAAGLFSHNVQSLRVVDVLERGGRGLNLTEEVRDGIVCHTGSRCASTLEGRIVAIADRIGYVSHDIEDAVRGGIITEDMLPASTHRLIGSTHSERISSLVRDLISTSAAAGDIRLSDAMWDAMMELRSYLFEHVYAASDAKREDPKAEGVVRSLFDHYLTHVDEVPAECLRIAGGDEVRAVVDYVAGMTDRYALRAFERIFVPQRWHA